MNTRIICIMLSLTSLLAHANGETPSQYLDYRFNGSPYEMKQLEKALYATGINISPKSKPDEAACYLGTDKDYPNRLLLLCRPSTDINEKIAAAYFETLTKDNESQDLLSDVTMTVAAYSLYCPDTLQCQMAVSDTHTTRKPCFPAWVRGYSTAQCTHNGLSNPAHICK